MKPSPSLLYNNLTVASGNVLYAHIRQACTFALSSATASSAPVPVRKVESQHTDVIHTIRACSHNSATFVVITTEAGVQVWDRNAMALLHVWVLPAQPDASTSNHSAFARGVAINVTNSGDASICFGTSSGSLYAMVLTEEGKFKAPVEFKHHSSPITAVGSAYQSRQGRWTEDLGCNVVTADESGAIAVWEGLSSGSGGYTVMHTIAAAAGGAPAVSLAVRSDFVIAARLDGTVQLYGLRDGKLRADIAAHSRFLSAMDIHPTKDLIVTVAEDCTLNVWALPIGGAKGDCVLSVCWLHAALTGVAFCGPTSDDLAVVAYDTDEVHIYKASI